MELRGGAWREGEGTRQKKNDDDVRRREHVPPSDAVVENELQ